MNVTIVPVDKSAPYMLPSASCRLVVVEGKRLHFSSPEPKAQGELFLSVFVRRPFVVCP